MIAYEHMVRAARHLYESGGYEGAGMFGIVSCREDSDYVRKISLDDYAYNDFVTYVECNKDNPHLPKIKRVRRASNGVIVIMERLEQVDLGWRAEEALAYVTEEAAIGAEMADCIEYALGEVGYGYDSEDEEEQMLDEECAYEELAELLEDAWDTICAVCDEGRARAHNIDLHRANVMLRHDGTLVITDPWYSREGQALHSALSNGFC